MFPGKADLELYHSAIGEAEEYLKANKDISSQPLNSSNSDSPRAMARLQEDTDTFTQGLDSSGQEDSCSGGVADQNLTPDKSRGPKKGCRGTKKRNLSDMNGRRSGNKGKRAKLGSMVSEVVRTGEERGEEGEGGEVGERGEVEGGEEGERGEVEGEGGEGKEGDEMEEEGEEVRTGEEGGEGRGEGKEGDKREEEGVDEGGEVVRGVQLSCSEDATQADISQIQDIPLFSSSQLPM